MYGLTSKESLSKRQARWTKDVEDSVKSNPAQRALNRETYEDFSNNKGIISLMSDPNKKNYIEDYDLESNEDILELKESLKAELMKDLKKDLSKEFTKLSNECASLRKTLDDLSNSSDIINRINKLEQSLNDDSRNMYIRHETVTRAIPTYDNSSDFSVLTDGEREQPLNFPSQPIKNTFVPFYIKEDYAARDNYSKLDNCNFEMLIEILGFYDESPIIYPFGNEKNLPNFAEVDLVMGFKDADKALNGSAYGLFKKNSDGVYVIMLTDLYCDGEASGIEKYTLPLVLTCKTELVKE